MRYDIVVIGSGLAGMTAALWSLRQGKKTIVISAGESALFWQTGCIDLCGLDDDPWKAIKRLVQERPDHPYSLVSEEDIREALKFFVQEIRNECPYNNPSGSRNSWVPTATGDFRPTYLLPESQEVGAKRDYRVLAIDFKGFRDFSAQLMVTGINTRGYQWQVAEVEIGYGKNNFSSLDLAVYLDKEWPELLKQVKPFINNKITSVAFPAVLGLRHHLFIKRKMEEILRVPIFEVPTLPPSVPGVRLREALFTRLRQLGGEILLGFPVEEAKVAGDYCYGVLVNTPGRPRLIQGESYVLATGGIAGGGLLLEQTRVKEVIFGFPVTQNPGNWTNERCLGYTSHGFAKCGIRVNNKLQPLSSNGEVLLRNVFCAGRILAGYDPFVEANGGGVAIATGYKAALEAGRANKR
ncbi:glycerol 3-phosphate dehydrogenase (quinone) subunit B [Thermanaeromonas toyohensis ToBE]|uniref:Glycerol 3-phosphate dehydrogenase (Quinone) subunit B n=1 Tax=Thermanaeromonas toyohensis ToBE TaxID=698762 RepID=A0A1W1VY58_9FIRM|nr:anaerobic glycerol-3-phosphate dehydrogenase subunit GlpB [Thermanaeromonas toyohensis]SMB98180.1 glycerol 3-phosphate dehydrogenase (quinone) subunit B [Thermanaeromonas toyohensis ToBE]